VRATDLSELAAFDGVARHKSFTRAAKERGVTASAISHAVSNLENRLGVRLLDRITRNVSLTDAGEMLQASPASAFDVIASALDAVNQFRDTPFDKAPRRPRLWCRDGISGVNIALLVRTGVRLVRSIKNRIQRSPSVGPFCL
jgi:Bacterial regulatory helix-turn-helix protein, lysR family